MLTYLAGFRDVFTPLRLFRYVTFRAFMAAGTAFLLSLIFGRPFIGWLRRRGIGQHERVGVEMARIAHGGKEGTPTMGGLLILGASVASILLWGDWGNAPMWLATLTMLAMGGVGFWDDVLKWKRRDAGGLRCWQKLALQGVWMLLMFGAIQAIPGLRVHSRELMVPCFKAAVCTMPLCITFLFFFCVLVGTTNAANLTDGMDGLAAGCMASSVGTYAIFSYTAGHAALAGYLQIPAISGAHELTIVCASVLGACIGFLWWNAYPARVFMGDTGSEALGGVLAMVAILVKQELALLIVGFIFFAEALSVIIQRGSYKATRWLTGRGRRVFRMAPIHHHFEVEAKEGARRWGRDEGAAENAVVVRFWIVSIAAALVGLATLKIR